MIFVENNEPLKGKYILIIMRNIAKNLLKASFESLFPFFFRDWDRDRNFPKYDPDLKIKN